MKFSKYNRPKKKARKPYSEYNEMLKKQMYELLTGDPEKDDLIIKAYNLSKH